MVEITVRRQIAGEVHPDRHFELCMFVQSFKLLVNLVAIPIPRALKDC